MKLTRSAPLVVALIVAWFTILRITSAAEPSPIPTKLQAGIGGFLGASYFVELKDGELHYSVRKGGTVTPSVIRPTQDQWREFRKTIDDLSVWKWRADYTNRAIADGTQWRLQLQYSDAKIETSGSNDFPKGFDLYLTAVEKLLGGKTFR